MVEARDHFRLDCTSILYIYIYSFISLTAKSVQAGTKNSANSVPVGTKNYRFVESLRRNSTLVRVIRDTKQPPTTPIMVSRLPLLRHGLDEYVKSNLQVTRLRV